MRVGFYGLIHIIVLDPCLLRYLFTKKKYVTFVNFSEQERYSFIYFMVISWKLLDPFYTFLCETFELGHCCVDNVQVTTY